jgi:hypothetical protein
MKAQRRHELQQSDLAKVIKQAPGFWQQSGGRYLLMILAGLVIGLLIRYRISSNREATQQASESLSLARTVISELRSPRTLMMSQLGPPGEAIMRRRQMFSEANNAIGEATRLSDDRTVQAEALIARGDLNWSMATMPEIPGAATQPGAQIRDPRELLSNASEAYRSVVDNFADVKHAQIAARFGLAAIAENQGNWDAAQQQYQAITSQAGEFPAYKTMAQERLDILPKLRQPVLMAQASTEPTTQAGAASAPALPPFVAAPKPATTSATTSVTALPSAPATTKPAATTTAP